MALFVGPWPTAERSLAEAFRSFVRGVACIPPRLGALGALSALVIAHCGFQASAVDQARTTAAIALVQALSTNASSLGRCIEGGSTGIQAVLQVWARRLVVPPQG